MHHSKKAWLYGTLATAVLAGAATLSGTSTSRAEPQRGEERREMENHWRHNNGRWDYYHAADRRWYHTDGTNWYYHNGTAWEPYRFDRDFGRQGFERGGYRYPEGGNVVVPRHDIYRPR